MDQRQTKSKIKPAYILLAVVLAIVVVGIWYWQSMNSGPVIGDNVNLTLYTMGDKITGGIISAPFLKAYDQAGVYVSGAADINSNGSYEADEWLIKNINVQTLQNWNTNLVFKTDKSFPSSVQVMVVVSPTKLDDTALANGGVRKEVTVVAATQNLDELLGTTKPKHPEQSMKEGQASTQGAAAPAGNGVPDFGQRIAECAPTVAANGLYGLAMKNGAADKLPKNPQDMIDGLKEDMRWTAADGVVPDDFVAGKNAWAVTHGLPIKTEVIGETDGRGTLDAIKDALAKSGAVEMRLRFSDENLNVIGGHVVTVVGVREVDGQTMIDIHDPLSPAGTESYNVSANSFETYPYHNGDVSVGIAFAEYWEGAPMGGQLDPMTDQEMQGVREFAGETKTIKAIKVGDKYIPLSQVHIGKGEHCDDAKNQFPHWHANNGGMSVATDGTKMPDTVECGYGKAINVPVVDVQIP